MTIGEFIQTVNALRKVFVNIDKEELLINVPKIGQNRSFYSGVARLRIDDRPILDLNQDDVIRNATNL